MICIHFNIWTMLSVVFFLPGISWGQSMDIALNDPLRSVVKRYPAIPAPPMVAGTEPQSKPVPPGEATSESGGEVIRERFANGTVKIERDVIQDAQGNYLNHGLWKQFDEKGLLISEGRFDHSERIGDWMRILRRSEAAIFNEVPFNEFQEPFVSKANFKNGKLQGKWTLSDSQQRRMSEIEFEDGVRHGTGIWWFANGQKMRILKYEQGMLNGDMPRWDGAAKLLGTRTFQQGRELVQHSSEHPNHGKREEGMYLAPISIVKTPDDWAETKFATYSAEGQNEKQGLWNMYHPNGQLQLKGKYEKNVPVGDFTWWYSNGQQALTGSYEQGKSSGLWVWYHENGQKKVQGAYADGHPTGDWSFWNLEGKLTKRAALTNGQISTEEKGKLPGSAMLEELGGPVFK